MPTDRWLPVAAMGMYRLDADRKPVPLEILDAKADREVWAADARRVAETTVGDAWVSTVFLVIDHSFGSGPPVLFETMIFGGEHDEFQDRYRTWEQAMAGHDRVVRALREGREP